MDRSCSASRSNNVIRFWYWDTAFVASRSEAAKDAIQASFVEISGRQLLRVRSRDDVARVLGVSLAVHQRLLLRELDALRAAFPEELQPVGAGPEGLGAVRRARARARVGPRRAPVSGASPKCVYSVVEIPTYTNMIRPVEKQQSERRAPFERDPIVSARSKCSFPHCRYNF